MFWNTLENTKFIKVLNYYHQQKNDNEVAILFINNNNKYLLMWQKSAGLQSFFSILLHFPFRSVKIVTIRSHSILNTSHFHKDIYFVPFIILLHDILNIVEDQVIAQWRQITGLAFL